MLDNQSEGVEQKPCQHKSDLDNNIKMKDNDMEFYLALDSM